MESCPKRDGYVKIDFAEENLYLYTEEGEQGRLPVLILSLRERNQYRRPAVVWDLIKLTDYLTERKDVDPSRIGITGESLGGMHAWVAAAADTRYAVGVPIIGVQKHGRIYIKIAPGVAHEFDAPHSILAITPRPLLILNGEEDPRCPVEGLQSAMERVVEAYYLAKSPGNFKFISEPGIGHEMTPLMVKEASNWFDKFLN